MKGYYDRKKGTGIVFETPIWLLNGARTGFGKLTGTIARISPTDLGIAASRAALQRAGVSPEEIDQVVISNITQSSEDAYFLPRHIGLYSGVPWPVPAVLIQRLCGSGFETIMHSAEQIGLGKAAVVLSGATENMSLSPTVNYGGRMGYPLGQVKFLDFLSESLKDTAVGGHMGCTAETLGRDYNISREDVDAFALRSQELAVASETRRREEMVAIRSEKFEVEGLHPRGIRLPRGVEEFAADEHIRATTKEALANLRPAFEGDGIQTAGNSSGIVDGAGAMIVSSDAYRTERGLPALARLHAAATVGVDPRRMGIGPAPAIRYVLEMTGLSLSDIDLIEINEAFAGQFVACERELGLDREICNVNGGAIAIGHPLSATGQRLTLTLAMELRRRGLRYGIASACVGGGQGVALLIENTNA